MARSEYVYVVIDPKTSEPGTFTVKHELVTWLSRHPDPSSLLIWRCRDGRLMWRPPVRVALADLGITPSA